VRSRAQAERRAGRLLERHARAAKLFDVTVSGRPDPERPGQTLVDVAFAHNAAREAWAALSEGCYLLRTNLPAGSPEHLWKTYIGLTQVEDCFRVEKHDLSLRPVFHQRQDRTQAHILVCFLALVLWRTLQHWMATSGLGTAPRPLLEAMREVRSLDVILPAQTGEEIRLRVVSRPGPGLAVLLQRLGLPLPNRPRRVANVVTTSTP